MFKHFVKAIVVISIFCSANILASEYCSSEKIDQDLSGKWKGEDEYYFQIRINNNQQLCISIDEDGNDMVRTIRDIVIVDGKLKHLIYYTPSTDGYVVYANIKLVDNEMSFYWYSSFENKSGEDIYVREEKEMKKLTGL